MDQDSLQSMSNLISNTMEIVNGVSRSCGSTEGWWMEQPSSAPTSSHQYLAPSSYNFAQNVSESSYPWEYTFPINTPNTAELIAPTYPNPIVSPQVYQSRAVSPQEFTGPALSPEFPSPPPYPYSYSNGATNASYYSGSPTMDDISPASSPESLDIFDKTNGTCPLPQVVPTSTPILPSCIPPPPLTSNLGMQDICSRFSPLGYPAAPPSVTMSSKNKRQQQPRMPQRKGGIQLWQFLYALLSDAKHSNIIEWTSNRTSSEFRMLEPESIAVWWGTIKSKPTMTYDKFSRSLRYYYHKGILRKIQGERYMYRFLVDPEDMYRHIGSTDKRPELKSMPKEAKMVMGIFQKQSLEATVERAPIVTKPPEGLQSTTRVKQEKPKTLKVESFGLDFNNSNNTSTDSDFQFALNSHSSLPILIPTAAW